MKTAERLLTIVITATITSAAWIVFGGSLLGGAMLSDEAEAEAEASAAAEGDAPVTDQEPDADAVAGGEGSAQSLNLNDAAQLENDVIDQMIIPVMGVSANDLVDSFADARSGGERIHEAIDIMADTGTSVIAAAPGTIERLFRSDAGGNTIYIRSENGLTIYYYAHMDEYAPGLQEGQQIRRGQRLGSVGSTGNADPGAPHLHFAILRTMKTAKWWEPANAVNPYEVLKDTAARRARP